MSGRMRDLIVFEEPIVTTPNGYRTVTWSECFREFAEPTRLSETSVQFILHYRSDVTTKSHRIKWDGAIWRIASVVHDLKRTRMTILSDITTLVEATDLDSETTEYVDNVPVAQPRE